MSSLHPLPSGLRNGRNVCFSNSVIQCFIHLPPVSEYLKSLEHDHYKNKKEHCLPCALWQLLQSTTKYTDTKHTETIMERIDSEKYTELFNYNEQDVYEFFIYLYDTLTAYTTKKHLFIKQATILEMKWTTTTSKATHFHDHPPINALMATPVTLSSSTTNIEHALHLSFDPTTTSTTTSTTTLSILLRDYFKQETNVEYKPYCSVCDKRYPIELCTRTSQIIQFPFILTIKLNRFHTHTNKISIPVSYPLELAFQSSKPNYTLWSLILHIGESISDGHYISYFKQNGVYYQANDSRVKEVSQSELILQHPKDVYVLFYLRNDYTYKEVYTNMIHTREYLHELVATIMKK